MTLFFYTSNLKKFTYAQSVFTSQTQINLVHKSFDFKELQTDNPQENLLFKLSQIPHVPATNIFIEDSTFHIDALNGFPSLYTKYILSSIGAQGIISLLDGREHRDCYFINHVALRAADNQIHFFSGITRGLSISFAPSEKDSGEDFSDLWKILKVTKSGQFYHQLTVSEKQFFNQQNCNSDAFKQIKDHMANMS